MIQSRPTRPCPRLQGSALSFTSISATSLLTELAYNPVTWSVAIMLTIVGLLVLWETAIEVAREEVPPAIESVIDKVLGEMGGLGFIGLALAALLHQPFLQESLEHVSEHFLGDGELLLETFEFLHQVFFQTAMLFFAGAAVLVLRVISTLKTVAQLAEDAVNETQSAGCSLMDKKLEQILGETNHSNLMTTSNRHDMEDLEAILLLEEDCYGKDGNNIWLREFSLTPAQRGAEALIVRERLIREMNLEGDFKISDYMERVFADKKFDLVEVSPSSWIPLIPSIALANALDLSHEVINAESANAVASSGFFLSTPWVFWPTLIVQATTLVWGLANFYKMASIKTMLLPGFVVLNETEDNTRSSRLVPPRVESPELRRAFAENVATPAIAKPFELQFSEAPTNRVEEIYGTVGRNGSEFYLNSIKFHLWKCATGWIAFSQVIPRDLFALTHPSDAIGDPDHLVAELVVFCTFALCDFVQVATLIPTTFLNYCIITTVEDMVAREERDSKKKFMYA